MEDRELVLLALGLSILGYNIGVLLIMLPIPFSGLKRWGPTLIKDSIFSAVLILSFFSIVEFIESIQSMIGIGWGEFRTWLLSRTSALLTFKISLTGISVLLSKFLGGFIAQSLFEPVLRVLNYALTALYSIMALGLIVKNYFVKLLLIGIVLFSVPFRFARGAGSYLIAFAVVFTVGLPFMPSFIELFSDAVSYDIPQENVEPFSFTYAVFDVRNRYDKPVFMPVIVGLKNTSPNSILFKYGGGPDGKVLASFPEKPIPFNTSYYILLDYLGMYAYMIPFPFNPKTNLMFTTEYFPDAKYKATLSAPHLLWSKNDNYAAVFVSNFSISHLVGSSNSNAIIRLSNPQSSNKVEWIDFRIYKKCEHEVSIPDDREKIVRDDKWYGIDFISYRVEIPPGDDVTVKILVGNCKIPPSPKVDEYNYLGKRGFSLFRDFSETAASIFVQWIVLPTVYLFLLLSITAGVAYAIGGLRERFPMRFA